MEIKRNINKMPPDTKNLMYNLRVCDILVTILAI